jgi:formylglycine-generating enzyme required for sulfatase activity
MNAGAATRPEVLAGMRRLPGGTFRMGSDRHYPEEAPSRLVSVEPFHIDETPVTNAAFARFVEATGYVTLAERTPSRDDYPDADPEMRKPGSAVFFQTHGPVPLDDHFRWWRYVVGASWRAPYGRDSNLDGLAEHPVVHVACEDAQAYAGWAGKSLPTEPEWEFAARGGLDGAPYAWGEKLEPDGAILANYWQGRFPWENLLADGYARTSPARAFPPNGYGLYDMIGNVWEWTCDVYLSPADPAPSPCCAAAGAAALARVIKGGSHLCAENYCRRYRPAARHREPIDTSTTHRGFRCGVRA